MLGVLTWNSFALLSLSRNCYKTCLNCVQSPNLHFEQFSILWVWLCMNLWRRSLSAWRNCCAGSSFNSSAWEENVVLHGRCDEFKESALHVHFLEHPILYPPVHYCWKNGAEKEKRKKHEYRGNWNRNGHRSFQPSQLQQLFFVGNEAVLEGPPKMNRTATQVWKTNWAEKEATQSCLVTAIGYVSQFSYRDVPCIQSELRCKRSECVGWWRICT